MTPLTWAQLAGMEPSELGAVLLTGTDKSGNPTFPVFKTNSGFMAPGQTQKNYCLRKQAVTSTPTTVNLETVTTGKTYYLTDIIVNSDAAQTNNVEVRVQAAGVDIWCGSVHALSPIDCQGIETQPFATSGQVLSLVLTAATGAANIWANVYGFEQ